MGERNLARARDRGSSPPRPRSAEDIGRLEAGRSVQARDVAERGAQRAVGVDPVELAARVAPVRGKDAPVAVEDPAAHRGPGGGDDAGIARVVGQVVGAQDLPVARPQRHAAEGDREGNAQPDHPTTQRPLATPGRSGGGHARARPSRRARRGSAGGTGPRSENASRSPTTSPFTSQRRPSVADEGKRDAGQRDELQVAGRDDHGLHADHEREARGEQRPDVVRRAGRDAEAARHDHEVAAEDRDDAGHAKLLAQGGEREVRVDGRDRQLPRDRREAGSQAGPQQPASRERMERLDGLVAGPERVRPRVQPGRDALAHGREDEREDREAQQEERDPEQDVHLAPGCEVEQAEEDREEEQRGAQVPLDDDDAQRQRQHENGREQVRGRRQREPAGHVDPRVGQQDPVLRQVPGEEDHQDDLEQLRGLPAHRPEIERQDGAIHVPPEHEREQEQAEAQGCPAVLVESQPAVRANRDGDAARDREGQDQPDELERGETERRRANPLDDQVLGQALGEEQTEPPQHPDRGQEHLVEAAPGQDQHNVDRCQGPEVRRKARGMGDRQAPGPGGPERQATEEERPGDRPPGGPARAIGNRAREAGEGDPVRRCPAPGATVSPRSAARPRTPSGLRP